MKRYHSMPFGTELLADGRVNFRLWAPGVKNLELCLEPGDRQILLPMHAGDQGWFSLATKQAAVGSRYCFRINQELCVPDPASRYQPQDVHGPSVVVEPEAFQWRDDDWRGRPWEEVVLYELHVGAFSPAGNFAAVRQRLDYLLELGITAIELMPVANFPGARNWGYDGALLFAPDSCYGTPDDLKDLVQCAHEKGLMVFLDVVYNHFGPEGNYLHTYAPQFFTEHHHTPWGAAINFDTEGCEIVRQFFIHNALYWLEEFHLDGLRLDAVHAIMDDSSLDILQALAEAVREGPGRQRHVHLVLENDHNATRYLTRDEDGAPQHYVAQWNDDFHHAMHVLLTHETDGYYADYADDPIWYLGRCLTEGFAYQGETSIYRNGAVRGEPTNMLPPTAFVSFLQNHDQVGNRAFGERLISLTSEEALRAAVAAMLLAPAPPLLFMGEEFGSRQPFQFFCNFGADLAQAVTQGRRREFTRFARFADPAVQQTIPDPNAAETFERSKLDWESLLDAPQQELLDFYRSLLTLRQQIIIPRLQNIKHSHAEFRRLGETGLRVHWHLTDESELLLICNLGHAPLPVTAEELPGGNCLYAHPEALAVQMAEHRLPPWSVAWFMRESSS